MQGEIADQARARDRRGRPRAVPRRRARPRIGPGDEELADILRRSRKPVILVANKLDDPERDDEALEFHELGLGDPLPLSALHGIGTGDLLDQIVETPARRSAPSASSARRRDRRRHPRPPERRQVVAPERAARQPRTIVSRDPRHDARLDRHPARARGSRLPADRHRRPAPQAQAPPGGRVLERDALARRRPPRRRRAGARRRLRGRRRAGPARRGRGAQGRLRDDRRALEVGHRAARPRGRARAPARQAAPAAAGDRDLGAHRPRPRAPAARRSTTSTTATRAASAPASSTGCWPRPAERRQPPLVQAAAASRCCTARRCRRARRASA